jgi:hypothetical protein
MLAREKLNGALDALICREVLKGTIEFSELRCSPGAELSRPQSREQCFHVHCLRHCCGARRRLDIPRFYRPDPQALSSKLY